MIMANQSKCKYRVSFINQDKIYDIYVGKVCESEMFGFIELEDIIFGENTSVVVDPSEERLRVEFSGVTRTYIPMHAVLRIDEVEKEGIGKVRELKEGKSNVTMFPGVTKLGRPDSDQK